MNKLTDEDKKFGPLTFAKSNWKRISVIFSTELDEGEHRNLPNTLTIYAFGWIVRLILPGIIKPFAVKVRDGWDEATVKRMGRNYYFNYFDREYGFSLSDGDFFQLYYGINAGFQNLPEGVKEKSWCKHLPWKQWNCVRHSLYNPDGSHFFTEPKRKKGIPYNFSVWHDAKDNCPKTHFKFMDYDQESIIATCTITEREWHRGDGWFKWLRFLYSPKICRSLDLAFSAEVGPEKGSWKGGMIGHGIDMMDGETPEDAFKRYCEMEHSSKHRKFKLLYIGPCDAPPKREISSEDSLEECGSKEA